MPSIPSRITSRSGSTSHPITTPRPHPSILLLAIIIAPPYPPPTSILPPLILLPPQPHPESVVRPPSKLQNLNQASSPTLNRPRPQKLDRKLPSISHPNPPITTIAMAKLKLFRSSLGPATRPSSNFRPSHPYLSRIYPHPHRNHQLPPTSHPPVPPPKLLTNRILPPPLVLISTRIRAIIHLSHPVHALRPYPLIPTSPLLLPSGTPTRLSP